LLERFKLFVRNDGWLSAIAEECEDTFHLQDFEIDVRIHLCPDKEITREKRNVDSLLPALFSSTPLLDQRQKGLESFALDAFLDLLLMKGLGIDEVPIHINAKAAKSSNRKERKEIIRKDRLTQRPINAKTAKGSNRKGRKEIIRKDRY